MQIFYFSNTITIILDFVAWFFLHMIIAYAGTLLPVSLFGSGQWLFKTRGWERGGLLYESLFRVDRWKDRLPDGASWFTQGFAKRSLKTTAPEFLERFVKETCRGEFVHWFVILVSPLFFLFNPWYAGWIMIVYALCANLPCIIIQRYNRPRFIRILLKKAAPKNR